MYRYIFLIAVFIMPLAHSSQTHAQAHAQAEVSANQYVELLVPADEGIVHWKDVAGLVAQSMKLDGPSVAQLFPTGSLDLNSATTLLVLMGIDYAAGDAMSIGLTYDEMNRPSLRIRCSQKSFGQPMVLAESLSVSMDLDSDWRSRTEERPLVVCLHGLKSQAEKFSDLRSHLRQHGIATASISYNDQLSIDESANQVSQFVAHHFSGAKHPKLVLIGHSMGGLVAREWTEDATLNNQSIVGLITVGTPHRGSNWASLPPLLDFFAGGQLDSSDLIDVLLHRPSAAGLSDLTCDSAFLKTLNSRPRRADVRYTTIVGTGSPVSAPEVEQLRETLKQMDQDGSIVRLVRPRIRPLLESFDELVAGKGDGVVSVESATIEGVHDIVKVDLSHVDFFGAPIANKEQAVWRAILERVNR